MVAVNSFRLTHTIGIETPTDLGVCGVCHDCKSKINLLQPFVTVTAVYGVFDIRTHRLP
jgi:hypothetical protein